MAIRGQNPKNPKKPAGPRKPRKRAAPKAKIPVPLEDLKTRPPRRAGWMAVLAVLVVGAVLMLARKPEEVPPPVPRIVIPTQVPVIATAVPPAVPTASPAEKIETAEPVVPQDPKMLKTMATELEKKADKKLPQESWLANLEKPRRLSRRVLSESTLKAKALTEKTDDPRPRALHGLLLVESQKYEEALVVLAPLLKMLSKSEDPKLSQEQIESVGRVVSLLLSRPGREPSCDDLGIFSLVAADASEELKTVVGSERKAFENRHTEFIEDCLDSGSR